jgi:DNA-directed RNA polymerase subunit RPC12/RpoP
MIDDSHRLYVCARCGAPERGPLEGGSVSCSHCSELRVLPARSAPARSALQGPLDDPAHLQELRGQARHTREVPGTLQTVLGGADVQRGREREALAIWEALRARAERGDAAASEDLAALTLLLVETPMPVEQPALLREALLESACDAAALPRHRQELLGALARGAAGRGERARAARYLGWMAPGAPDLESDSAARVSAAALGTLDRDGRRVLDLLGPTSDFMPIVPSLVPLAVVLRANAYELLGDSAAAAQALRELPGPHVLARLSASFPALRLCARTGPAYAALATQEAARRATSNAGDVGMLVGGALALVGAVLVAVAVFGRHRSHSGIIGPALAVVIGVILFARARARGRRAGWLRANGLPLTAHILRAEPTGTIDNGVPVYRLTLRVEGPERPYEARFEKAVRAPGEAWVRRKTCSR